MLELIIKPCCAHCKSQKDIRFGLCADCLETVAAYAPASRCRICGLTIRGEGTICQRCLAGTDSFDQAFFLFPYEEAGRTLIHQIKFRDRLEWLSILNGVENLWCPILEGWHPDAVTWIPSSLHARWGRGYNVSRELGKKVAEALDVPCVELLRRAKLFKRRLSATQTPAERKRVIRQFLKGPQVVPEGISHVLIVDDVFTTGATANRATKLLKEAAGIREVSVFTLARVCP